MYLDFEEVIFLGDWKKLQPYLQRWASLSTKQDNYLAQILRFKGDGAIPIYRDDYNGFGTEMLTDDVVDAILLIIRDLDANKSNVYVSQSLIKKRDLGNHMITTNDCDYIFFPMFTPGHWWLLIIDMKKKNCISYDSCGGNKAEYISTFLDLLKPWSRDIIKEFEYVKGQCGIQTDSVSCGYRMLLMIWAYTTKQGCPSDADIENMYTILLDLLLSKDSYMPTYEYAYTELSEDPNLLNKKKRKVDDDQTIDPSNKKLKTNKKKRKVGADQTIDPSNKNLKNGEGEDNEDSSSEEGEESEEEGEEEEDEVKKDDEEGVSSKDDHEWEGTHNMQQESYFKCSNCPKLYYEKCEFCSRDYCEDCLPQEIHSCLN